MSKPAPTTRPITFVLDALDYQAVMEEINRRITQGREVPDGESDTKGSHLAEIVRDLIEYREMFHLQNPAPAPRVDPATVPPDDGGLT